MSADAIFIVLMVGFTAYVVLKIYQLVLGCILVVIATFAFLALIYGVLWLFGLVT